MVIRDITVTELVFLLDVLEGEEDSDEAKDQAIELIEALIMYEAPIH